MGIGMLIFDSNVNNNTLIPDKVLSRAITLLPSLSLTFLSRQLHSVSTAKFFVEVTRGRMKRIPSPLDMKCNGNIPIINRLKDNGKCHTEIESFKTVNGSWTRDQLDQWGIPWPPPKGCTTKPNPQIIADALKV